ncbi:MAG: zinc ribbon domain-containing protein [Gammaproteobacteria bacterium]|nr:zinc ribbon domain-containing protein [Gammaproteobacteria bacterium]
MPTYDYKCEANGQILEAKHKMNESISTWGELCALANIPLGDTPAEAPVVKLATGGQIVSSRNLGNSAQPACASGPCCGANSCDFTNG